MTHDKMYLGDSVYVEMESEMVKLTTNNGYPDDPRNVIYLDRRAVQALIDWLSKPATERSRAGEDGSDG